MFKLFDATFFKFLFGFTFILAISFIILFLTGLYQSDSVDTATPPVSGVPLR